MSAINKLLGIPSPSPERKTVALPRLRLEVTLQEISYDALMSCRQAEDSHFHYLLKSTVEPNFRDPAWYQDKMGCPTPVEAMKKLLRAGEVERLCRVADALNGYGPGSVSPIGATQEQLEARATEAAYEELQKN